MLTDPKAVFSILLGAVTDGIGGNVNFSLVQGDNTKVTRKADSNLGISDAGTPKLTVSRSTSSENKGQVTDRVAIRLEVPKPVVISDADAVATAQVTVTASIPRYGFVPGDIPQILLAIISFLSTKEGTDAVNILTDYERVLTGEA